MTNMKELYAIVEDIEDSDSPYKLSPYFQEMVREIFPKVIRARPSVEKKLFRLIKQFPNVAQFQNYLVLYYMNADREEKAIEWAEKIWNKFPDYTYGYTALLRLYWQTEQNEKLEKLGSGGGTLDYYFPGRTIFYEDEVQMFHFTYAFYLEHIKDYTRAKAYLDIVDRYPTSPEMDEDIAQIRARISFVSNPEMVKKVNLYREYWTERRKKNLEAILEARSYEYNHPSIIEAISEEDIMEVKPLTIEGICSRDRETLIQDLEHHFLTPIYNLALLEEDIIDDDEFDELTEFLDLDLVVILIEHLRSEASVPVLLEVLKQSPLFEEEYTIVTETFYDYVLKEALVVLGANYVPDIMDCILKDYLSPEALHLLFEVLASIRYHYPEKSVEIDSVSKLFLEVLDSRYDTFPQEDIMPVIRFSLAIGQREITEYIQQLKSEERIDEREDSFGDEHFLMSKEEKNDYVLKTLSGSLEERVSRLQENMDSFFSNSMFEKPPLEEVFSYLNDEELEPDLNDEETPWTEPRAPMTIAHRKEHNVGRNDPCPCGSGKKYKKCCLNV